VRPEHSHCAMYQAQSVQLELTAVSGRLRTKNIMSDVGARADIKGEEGCCIESCTERLTCSSSHPTTPVIRQRQKPPKTMKIGLQNLNNT
jgi:hypothetical protein